MKTRFFRLFALLAIVTLVSCSDKAVEDTPAITDAKISGKVVTPSGKPVALAKVKAGSIEVKTNRSGLFTMNVPPGSYELTIKTGSGSIFLTKIPVTVESGENLVLQEPETILKQIKQLAYIPGIYDKIEEIIIDSLGYAATPIGVGSLDNMSNLTSFGAIFLNCGLLEAMGAMTMNTLRYQNLLAYVNGYGSLYASKPASGSFINRSESYGTRSQRIIYHGHLHDSTDGWFYCRQFTVHAKSGTIRNMA
jgi:hypothetical protein